MVTLNPAGPPAHACRGGSHARAVAGVAGDGVFVVVIIGIYGGWANPRQTVAIGAAARGILAIVTGGMRAKGFPRQRAGHRQCRRDDLPGAARTDTALALSQMPVELAPG